jgi:hypothetical protein
VVWSAVIEVDDLPDVASVPLVGLDVGVGVGHRAVWLDAHPDGLLVARCAVVSDARMVPDAVAACVGRPSASECVVAGGADLWQRGHAGGLSASEMLEAAGAVPVICRGSQFHRLDLIRRMLDGGVDGVRLRVSSSAGPLLACLGPSVVLSQGGTRHAVADGAAGHMLDALGYGLSAALMLGRCVGQ